MSEELDRLTKYKNFSKDFSSYGKIFLWLILILFVLSFVLDSSWFRIVFIIAIVGGVLFLYGGLGLKHGVHISKRNISGQPNFSTGPFARKLNFLFIILTAVLVVLYIYFFK